MTSRAEPPPTRLRPDPAASRRARPAAGPGDMVLASPRRWARHLWWLTLTVGAAAFAIAWLSTPHGREIDAIWELGVKLFAFLCLCTAIAFFPWVSRRHQQWLLLLPFLFFTGYVLPRISYFYYGDILQLQADSFYTHMYMLLYPGIVLTVAAAYRLGGGTPGRCLKTALSGILIVFSGFLDVMWQVVNPVEIPDLIDAPHITIFTGRPISFGATIVFTLAHLPFLVALNLLPLDRWIGRLLAVGRSVPEPPSGPPEPPTPPELPEPPEPSGASVPLEESEPSKPSEPSGPPAPAPIPATGFG